MLTEQQVTTGFGAQCRGCGIVYPGESLPFLYVDELGYRCPDCGDILMVGSEGDLQVEEPGPCRLMLSERLEGSSLHGMLVELSGGEERLELLVDRADEVRTVSLASSVPPDGPASLWET